MSLNYVVFNANACRLSWMGFGLKNVPFYGLLYLRPDITVRWKREQLIEIFQDRPFFSFSIIDTRQRYLMSRVMEDGPKYVCKLVPQNHLPYPTIPTTTKLALQDQDLGWYHREQALTQRIKEEAHRKHQLDLEPKVPEYSPGHQHYVVFIPEGQRLMLVPMPLEHSVDEILQTLKGFPHIAAIWELDRFIELVMLNPPALTFTEVATKQTFQLLRSFGGVYSCLPATQFRHLPITGPLGGHINLAKQEESVYSKLYPVEFEQRRQMLEERARENKERKEERAREVEEREFEKKYGHLPYSLSWEAARARKRVWLSIKQGPSKNQSVKYDPDAPPPKAEVVAEGMFVLQNPTPYMGLPPEEALESDSLKYKVTKMLDSGALTERERYVLNCHFGFEGAVMTLDQIGATLDLTASRVRQIEIKALSKLRHPCNSAPLREHLR